jgi:NADH dehydrogenase [ubiquinone] 1 alpha subcomplex assembly factor 7
MLSAKTRPPSLAERLTARIAAEGPISVEEYMLACLLDAREGVYAARDPIGAQGDFITAPETSQIFGELLGLWAVSAWQSMGEPSPVTVAELGPGRGTLMADALRAWRAAPEFLRAAGVALVEASPLLAETQRRTLAAAGAQVAWYDDLSAVPETPLIVLANEFIDALPIRQFVRRGDAWRERLVADDGKSGFEFVDGPPVPGERLAGLDHASEGAVIETRPAAEVLIRDLARRAASAPVAALIVDYGHAEPGFGDTLQAVRGHRYADPLAAPGEADLTAHVDFAALGRDAEAGGLKVYGPMPQGEFLLKLGLGERRERLIAAATPAQQDAIASGALRLVDPAQMGVLFKALALTSKGLPPPPPFA